MKINHPSESEIQQYALDRTASESQVIQHIDTCEACRLIAQNYMHLFTAIQEQPKAYFDFDLASLVLQQLPDRKYRFSLNLFFPYVFASCGLITLGFLIYKFRIFILNLITGNFSITMYLVLLIPLFVLVFQSMDMYRRYRNQMSILK